MEGRRLGAAGCAGGPRAGCAARRLRVREAGGGGSFP